MESSKIRSVRASNVFNDAKKPLPPFFCFFEVFDDDIAVVSPALDVLADPRDKMFTAIVKLKSMYKVVSIDVCLSGRMFFFHVIWLVYMPVNDLRHNLGIKV